MKEAAQTRKADTRKKIMLGGLFIKAGFDDLHENYSHILYGMLLYNKRLMQDQPKIVDIWQELGKELIKEK